MSTEIDESLCRRARTLLGDIASWCDVSLHATDPMNGIGEFDRVIVWPATSILRREWFDALGGRGCLVLTALIQGVQFFLRCDQWETGGRLVGRIVGRPHSSVPVLQPNLDAVEPRRNVDVRGEFVRWSTDSISAAEVFPLLLFCASEGIDAVVVANEGDPSSSGLMYVVGSDVAFIGNDGIYVHEHGVAAAHILAAAYLDWKRGDCPGVRDYVFEVWPRATSDHIIHGDVESIDWRGGTLHRGNGFLYRVTRAGGGLSGRRM